MVSRNREKTAIEEGAGANGPLFADAARFTTADSNLGAQLLFTANALDQRGKSLSAARRALAGELSARVGAEGRLVAQALRLTVGVIWLCIAIVLLVKSGQPVGAGLAPGEAGVLARVFFMAGVPASILAIAVAIYVQSTRGNNQRVRQAADRLGREIAAEAKALDHDISGLVQSISRGGSLGADIENLSKAQYKAIEAQMFFRGLRFLTPETHQQSMDDLKRFLASTGQASVLVVFATAFSLGAGLSYLVFAERGGYGGGPMPDIFLYPGYVLTLLIGGSVYLLAGVMSDILAPVFGAVRRRALEDALDAVRGAFIANDAPRFAEIVRRVDDAMAVLQSRAEALERDAARGPARSGGADLQGQTHTDCSPRAHVDGPSDLAWRDRDSSAQFVDVRFQAAPKPFALDSESKQPARSDPAHNRDKSHRKKWLKR